MKEVFSRGVGAVSLSDGHGSIIVSLNNNVEEVSLSTRYSSLSDDGENRFYSSGNPDSLRTVGDTIIAAADVLEARLAEK